MPIGPGAPHILPVGAIIQPFQKPFQKPTDHLKNNMPLLQTYILLGDITFPDGKGTILPAAVVVAAGTILPGSITLPKDSQKESGEVLPGGITLPCGTTLPSSITLPGGTIIPGGTWLLRGIIFPAGTNVPADINSW